MIAFYIPSGILHSTSLHTITCLVETFRTKFHPDGTISVFTNLGTIAIVDIPDYTNDFLFERAYSARDSVDYSDTVVLYHLDSLNAIVFDDCPDSPVRNFDKEV